MNYYKPLDPERYRFRNAFYSLTVVRLLLFIARSIGRGVLLLTQLGFRLLRVVGLFFIDVIYGFKVKLVDLKYSGRREKIQLRSIMAIIGLFISQLVTAFFQLFRRTGRLTVEGVKRTGYGLADEARAYRHMAQPRDKRSAAWSAINFALILCAIMLPVLGYAQWRKLEPLRQRVLSATGSAVAQLSSAGNLLGQQNFAGANQAFGQAGQNFLMARQELAAVNGLLLQAAAVVPNDTFRLAATSRHLLAAGELSSRLGEQLTGALTLPVGQEATTINFLENFIAKSESALPLARDLEKEIGKIDPEVLPEPYRTKVAQLSGKASFLANSLEEALNLAYQLEIFLGKDMDKRYMLVFQNNAEKRATGGFIGSFAIVDFKKGNLVALNVPKGGSYDTEAGLSRLIAAPEPLRLLNPLWHFWDANWWPDWPTSAQNLMRFYEESNGPTVDGVISLTPTVIERLLMIVGPVDMTADYGVIITADNFWPVTQTFSEQKPHETKEPKKIIGDLMNKLIAEAPQRLTPDKTIALIKVLEDSLNEKQILAYMTDPDLQAAVERFGWSGEVARTAGDYLMVVDSNIGGQKSDRVIEEVLDHHAEILPDGSILDTLTISRRHNGQKGQLFTGVRNVDWLRVYVPEGSTLVSASGFSPLDQNLLEEPQPNWESLPELEAEKAALIDRATGTSIYKEQGKTVFANWSIIDPGQVAEIRLTYRLPFTLPTAAKPESWLGHLRELVIPSPADTYSLLVQKQAGAERITLRSTVANSLSREVAWKYPANLAVEHNGWNFVQPLQTDIFAALLLK